GGARRGVHRPPAGGDLHAAPAALGQAGAGAARRGAEVFGGARPHLDRAALVDDAQLPRRADVSRDAGAHEPAAGGVAPRRAAAPAWPARCELLAAEDGTRAPRGLLRLRADAA